MWLLPGTKGHHQKKDLLKKASIKLASLESVGALSWWHSQPLSLLDEPFRLTLLRSRPHASHCQLFASSLSQTAVGLTHLQELLWKALLAGS